MAPELLERRERLEREKVELEEQWVANEKRSPETVGGKFEKPCVPLTPRGAARHIGPAGEYKEALGLLGPSPTGSGSPIDPWRMRWRQRRRKCDTRRA